MDNPNLDCKESDEETRNLGPHNVVSYTSEVSETMVIGTTRLRHLVLTIYFLSAFFIGVPFSHNFIGEKFVKYYNTDNSTVDLLALLYMGAFLLTFLPANWVFENKGLRLGVLLGLFASAIGAWLFCASQGRDHFWVALLAQAVMGVGTPFMLNVPPFLSSVWFPSQEVSRACAIASFANPVGILTAVAVLSLLINGEDVVTIENQFYWYHFIYATIISLLLILALIFFRDEPALPPSYARAEIKRNPAKPSVTASIKELLKNRNFMLQLAAFGFMNGTQNGFISIVNQLVLQLYTDASSKLWIIGLLLCVSGTISCLLTGIFLDVTHRYKETAIFIILATGICIGVLGGTENLGLNIIYVNMAILGFFAVAYLPAGLELAAELSYPVAEATATSLLMVAGYVCGIVLTFLGTWTLENHGALSTCVLFASATLIALIITVLIKPDLRRLEANRQGVLQVN